MIILNFDCHGCGLEDAKAFVRYRRKDEHIEAFMLEVGMALGTAHKLLSPTCHSKICDVKIPLDPNGVGIGYKPGLTEQDYSSLDKL